ncbi:methionine gamma-lyase [Neobacillus piezotolerans]|uniref:L-methionine gamma-lyase n=1 Tax=Neobacillus piezotolerans TaxID=2259171 RepID=A0A3D8GNV8_9BACI|nr:methionine gamma-lyase [Neobacillus piezotolerans]RDU36184.1 methionine gamma-lyase [Neobacillus piezotolerans]
MQEKDLQLETRMIHSGYSPAEHKGSLVPPLFQTSTFVFDNAAQGGRRFAGEEDGYIYTRLGNPTVKALEDRIAELEGGEAALAFSSGMAAVSAILFTLAKTGGHILCSQGVYGCTYGLLKLMEEKFGISHSFSDMETPEQVEESIRDSTCCIFIETPINPTMKLVDLKMVADIAKERGVPVVVDNTFSSPYLQNPLALGCDVSLHSATKYICGHGDVIAGVAAGKADFMKKVAMSAQKDIGGVISPFDAWLLLRGIKTLAVRMDRHCENAKLLFTYLKEHPKVSSIHYPGDPEHPDFHICEKQMKKPGGLISFTVEGTKETAQAFMDQLRLIKIAVSLGDAETLVQHPASMTHSGVSSEDRKKMGISDTMIRLSVGLEAWEDIRNDLEQAFSKM